MYGVIYLLINLVNGKMYVGQTNNLSRRIWQHKNGDQYVDKAIQKYGWENFAVKILEECETREQLNEREIFWIAFFNCKVPNGYNYTDGGQGATEQFGEKNHFYNQHHTDETKAILRQKQRERILRGETPAFLGHHHTEESKAQLSVSHRDESPYKNLISEMDSRQLTYTSLAELMGLSQGALSMKLHDKLPLTESDIAKLVEIFERPAEYLLARDDGKLPVTPALRGGENNPFYGRHHSGETRMIFSANNRDESPYKNLLAEMDKRCISYTNLAVLLGISQVNISRKMRGERSFTRKDIAKLVEIFGLPAEYLLERDDGVIMPLSNRGKTPYKNLLNEIQKRKMTYTELGELLGYPSHKSISEKMQGRKNFTAKDIAKLVEIFGLPAEYLMARDDGVIVTPVKRKCSPYKNLLAEMEKRQISVKNLAELLGISRVNVSRKIRGERNFTAKDIAKLVEIFGLPAEYLMARTDD